MKNQVFTLIVFLLSLFATQIQAQCPPGDVILSSEMDMKSFMMNYSNCQNINGDLIIGGSSSSSLSDITSLSPLSNIVSVSSRLVVRNNSLGLSSLDGLDMLTTIGGNMNLFNNDGMTSLSGLDALTSVGVNVTIDNNEELIDLAGLGALATIGAGMTITNNPSLTSLMGLENITEIRRFLTIASNNSLASMTGLDNLVTVGGNLDVRNNLNLTTFMGFESLVNVGGSFFIFGNFRLMTLDALSNLRDVCQNLQMFKNEELDDCVIPIMCHFTQDPNFDLFLMSNGTGCNTSAEIAAGVAAETVDCATAETEANFCNPLSTELVSLKASLQGRTAVLAWQTATETDNEGFEIQRSRDAITWTDISWKAGSGNSSELRFYDYTDVNIYRGINYYRLKQVDFGGTFTYSNTVSVDNISDDVIDIYPNPANDLLIVSGLDGRNIDEIIIHELGGKEAIRLTDTNNVINVSNLSPGMYVVVIVAGFDEKFLKLMID